jgi:hypothetical protein
MNRTLWNLLVMLSLIVPVVAAQALADGDAPADASPKALKGRLPAHYAKVVDDGQRQKIYAIQAEYAAKIQEVEQQLKALIDQRDAAIKAVLRPDQLKRIEELTVESKAKGRGRAQPETAPPGDN